MEQNPYAPPAAPIAISAEAPAEAEEIRKKHRGTERSIQVAGVLFVLGGVATVAMGISTFANMLESAMNAAIGVILAGAGAFQVMVGVGMRRLQKWARIPAIILSCIGLLVFPWGTIINLVILLSVAGKKGGYVMTPEYQQIIAATPHLNPRTSKALIGLLFVLMIVLLVIVYFGILRRA
jgi:protein-S-isoprenylcysteine O-methyltransferase Ste14